MAGVRWLDWYADGSVVVADVGLACCALEFDAAAWNSPVFEASRAGGAPRVIVVVSGTVTDRLAPAVRAIIDQAARLAQATPSVVSFGACASSGGPYWDSYAVTKGVDQLVEVDRYVPGCPPTPDSLRAVIDDLSERAVTP